MNKRFLECAAQARKNYANHLVSDHGVKRSYMDVYPMSWEHPKEDCGYGGVISTLFGSRSYWTRRNVQIKLGKNPSSNSGTFQKLRAAGLIESTDDGYDLTKLGTDYACAWLDDFEDAEDSTQYDEVISSVAQSIKCCAAAINCVSNVIGNSSLGSSIYALQKSVDELMKSI